MLSAAQPDAGPPRRVQLPKSSPRAQREQVYVRVVTGMRSTNSLGPVTYDGQIYPPGAVLDYDSLPQPAALIECAGRIGVSQRGKHQEYLYILWRWDYKLMTWAELARAQALDWSWTTILREAVRQALFPEPDFIDITKKGRTLADKFAGMLEGELENEIPEVKRTALHSLCEIMIGRLANCA